jgi:hypothetical protein
VCVSNDVVGVGMNPDTRIVREIAIGDSHRIGVCGKPEERGKNSRRKLTIYSRATIYRRCLKFNYKYNMHFKTFSRRKSRVEDCEALYLGGWGGEESA